MFLFHAVYVSSRNMIGKDVTHHAKGGRVTLRKAGRGCDPR